MIKRYICTIHGHECESVSISSDNIKDVLLSIEGWYPGMEAKHHKEHGVEKITIFVAGKGLNHQDYYLNALINQDITRVRVYGKWNLPVCHIITDELLPIPDGLDISEQDLFDGKTEFSKTFMKWSDDRRIAYGCRKRKL